MEEGLPGPIPQTTDSLPPGAGKFVLPPNVKFSQIVNLLSRTFQANFDEALRHNRINALAARRDLVIMDALRARQIPTAQLEWHIEAEDDSDPRQVEAVETITQIVKDIPRFQSLKMSLLEAEWFGRYASQVSYAWSYKRGKKQLIVRDHSPIQGDKLVFKFSGQAGVLVHSTYKGSWQPTQLGRAHFFTPEEREQIIIHKFEPEDADFFEGEFAGQLHGVGIRSRIYWIFWLKTQVLSWLMDYLERVGAGGFTIYYFEAGNQDSLKEVKDAAENQYRNNTILFPRYKNTPNAGPGVERIEPSVAGAQLLQVLVTEYFDGIMRRYILGQTLSSGTEETGMGSGTAELHADTLSHIIKYDAVALQETLSTDLISVLYKYNCPGVPPGKFVFDVDKPNAEEFMAGAKDFFEMGGTLDEDEVRSILGLSKPEAGHSVLSKIPPMSPTAASGVPTGVPMLGEPGPQSQPGGDVTGGQPPADAAAGQQPQPASPPPEGGM